MTSLDIPPSEAGIFIHKKKGRKEKKGDKQIKDIIKIIIIKRDWH